MALELRPNCELCDRDLPPADTSARICTYECTFCSDCVETKLFDVCPNCGGGFTARPIRPARAWREGLDVGSRPPSTQRHYLEFSFDEVDEFARRVRSVPAHLR